MKLYCLYCLLLGQLLLSSTAQAQTVIQGDSICLELQSGKSTYADVIRIMGKPNSITESRSFVHILFRGGDNSQRDGHGMQLDGYSFNYRKSHVSIILNIEKTLAAGIHCGPKSNVITARGIQPTKSTFADVVEKYAAINSTPKPRSFPINVKATKRYTYLRYQGITFISYGRWKILEELLTKPVDEIWF